MSPLSVGKYLKTHKRKSIGSALVIGLSIFLVLFMQVMVRDLIDGFSLSTGRLNHYSEVLSADNRTLNKVIKNLNESQSVKKIIPSMIMNSSIKNNIGVDSEFVIYRMEKENIKYTMRELGLTLENGTIESSKDNAIILSEMVAKNKKLKVGDTISKDKDSYFKIPGKYVVIGIMKGDINLGFIPSTNKAINALTCTNYLFFWKNGFRKEVDNELLSHKNKNFEVTNYKSDWKDAQDFSSSFSFICNLVIILIVIVQAIILGFTNYSEYYQRKEEFGVQKALGFKLKDILIRVFKEILSINVIAFIVGISLILIFIGVDNTTVVNRGIPVYRLISSDVLKVTVFPIVTTITSIFPVANLIRNTDTLRIIEGGH